MLFNSYVFIFLFLPVVLIGFFLLTDRAGREPALAWLAVASLFFYGWWNPVYLPIIVGSMIFNFAVGRMIAGLTIASSRQLTLAFGVAGNLALLGYFKYANFFVDNVNLALDANIHLAPIVLPLAISFFTFQQIAYLADVHSGEAREYSFPHYAVFVTFFPQLIAGPIVHHQEMIPQFLRRAAASVRSQDLCVGITIFSIGLFKKAVLADGVAQYASPVFAAAGQGEALTFFQAWGGALAYTFQLYFDFSGYSDMAIGAARMFGIRLPLNFFSPYKACSIIEFWRRWHMTLSRFLRDYVYIALGGNRHGQVRRYINLLTTMLLGGLWHGAGWTFVLWGALHGIYLVINHGWHWLVRRIHLECLIEHALWRPIAWGVTFVAVVVGWVLFRAEDMAAAGVMLEGMAGLNGVALPNAIAARLPADVQTVLGLLGIETYIGGGAAFVGTYLWVAALLSLSLVAPNTTEIMRSVSPVIQPYRADPIYAFSPFSNSSASVVWSPSVAWGLSVAIVSGFGVLALTNVSEFLYFQF